MTRSGNGHFYISYTFLFILGIHIKCIDYTEK